VLPSCTSVIGVEAIILVEAIDWTSQSNNRVDLIGEPILCSAWKSLSLQVLADAVLIS
jgi:hypothetical protein